MIGLTSAHMVTTMLDKNKGSMTNRFECAKEHAKNDMKMGFNLAVPMAVAGGAAYVKYAKPASKAAQVLTKGVAYLGKGLGKLTNKIAPNFAEKVMKNPAKFGAAGLAVAGGLYVVNRLMNWSNKKGKIDQKYEDAAKIESQTKNIVLEQMAAAKKADYIC